MRPQTKAPDQRPARSPSRTGVRILPGRQRQMQATQQPPARPQDRQGDACSAGSRHRRVRGRRSAGPERSAPLHPLTLRAMQGMRRRQRPSSGPLFVSLLSVLALLAFACFPVLAQAEVQYEDAPQKITVPPPKKPVHHSEPKANKSTSPESGGSQGGGGGGNTGSGGGGSGSGGSPSTSNPSTAGGNGNGQGNPGKAPTGAQKGGSVQQAKALKAPTTSSSSNGGSSPLVPILIAIAVLAAISVGIVVMRQRGQGGDDGPAVSSPEPS
jgi:hypothetical protein